MYIYIYIYTCVCICMYIYIYIYIGDSDSDSGPGLRRYAFLVWCVFLWYYYSDLLLFSYFVMLGPGLMSCWGRGSEIARGLKSRSRHTALGKQLSGKCRNISLTHNSRNGVSDSKLDQIVLLVSLTCRLLLTDAATRREEKESGTAVFCITYGFDSIRISLRIICLFARLRIMHIVGICVFICVLVYYRFICVFVFVRIMHVMGSTRSGSRFSGGELFLATGNSPEHVYMGIRLQVHQL